MPLLLKHMEFVSEFAFVTFFFLQAEIQPIPNSYDSWINLHSQNCFITFYWFMT